MDERLRKFLGKPKTYTIQGEEIVLSPLKGENLDLILNLGEGAESTKKFLLVALQQISEDATLEDIEELSVSFLNELTTAFLDVNGFSKK